VPEIPGLSAALESLADRLYANKARQGFNMTDVPLEFSLTFTELGEAFDAWRKGGDVGSELADAFLFLLSLARMTGTDLGAAAEAKMTVNEGRQYVRQPNGLHVQREASHA
jgi:NTP pyrophosphatase (non-canonical NTP hydrolase)